MKYRIVTESAVEDFDSTERFLAAMAERGATYMGDRAQYTGPIKLRPELVGQPTFREFAGPMWGGYLNADGSYNFSGFGMPSVRYEDWPTYERMSR